MSKNKISSAMFFVLLAGLIWSFGPLVVRNMDNAELVPWQYSLIRGSAIFIILNLYLFLTEGSKFTNNYNKIGLSGIIGGISLGIANLTFILSLTSTSAAVTLLMLGALPFLAAIIAYIFLNEKISKTTFIAIIIAAAGMSAHLAGVTAALTTIPVLGVPTESKLKGLDSLLSTVQMPSGIPVGNLAIGKAGAINAALLAISILSVRYKKIEIKLKKYRSNFEKKVPKKQILSLQKNN